MRFYLDTSVLVSALTIETATPRAQEWLFEHDKSALVISFWVISEFSAALSVKLRNRQVFLEDRLKALAAFQQMATDSFEVLQIETRHFLNGAKFADKYALGLRAGDALHLAICEEHGSTLCTLDKRLAEAGPELGVKTLLV